MEIRADGEIVWDTIVSIDRWPSWNPDVGAATLGGPVKEGTSFVWKAGPGRIRSIFRVVERPKVVGWTGKTLGIPAIHVYRLEAADGRTLVTTEESWDGFLARLFRSSFQRTLDKSVKRGLDALKTEAERRAARG